MAVLTQWPAQGLSVLWKQPAGLGYASFTIADGRAYTIEQRRKQEVVAAYDVNTGRELWLQGWNAEYTDSTGDGPRTTPTWDDGRLYALGATGELRCLDAKTGAVSWGKNILTDNQAQNLSWAMAASPLVVDDKVIVIPGGSGGKSVVAYNKLTGAPVWRSQATGQQMSAVYPMDAMRNEKIGVAVVRCVAAADGRLEACAVVCEGPKDWGFGAAALKTTRYFRLGPEDKAGRAVVGRTVKLPFRFNPPGFKPYDKCEAVSGAAG